MFDIKLKGLNPATPALRNNIAISIPLRMEFLTS